MNPESPRPFCVPKFDATRQFLRRTLALGCLAACKPLSWGNVPDAFPVRFEDIAAKAGLTELTVYGGVGHNRYILETTGCGAAFIDYDNDGWVDLFLVNGTRLDASPSQSRCRTA